MAAAWCGLKIIILSFKCRLKNNRMKKNIVISSGLCNIHYFHYIYISMKSQKQKKHENTWLVILVFSVEKYFRVQKKVLFFQGLTFQFFLCFPF